MDASGLRPDHVVVTGDHTHDELPERYAAVREAARAVARPPLAAPGQPRRPRVLRARVPGPDPRRRRRAHQLLVPRRRTGSASGSTRRSPARWAGASAPSRSTGSARQLDEHQPRAAVLFMHHPPVELGLAWLDRIGLDDDELLQALLVDEPRSPARLLRPRPPRVVAPGRLGGGRHGAVDGSPVQPRRRRRAFVTAPPGYRADRARRRRLLDDGRPPARGEVRADAAVADRRRAVSPS